MSDRVAVWLKQLGLDQYAEAFDENAIEWEQLRKLSDDDLKELGVAALGHRKRIRESAESMTGEFYTFQQNNASYSQDRPSNFTGDAERRQLTVMFCDLVGSTALSQKLDPEDMREVNLIYQDACKKSIERYAGYIAKYMGDGVLAYFGYPQAHEDDAERAVQAGLELVESVPGLNASVALGSSIKLAVRIGIATGLVVVGDQIGQGASQESAVVGETPNLAARLQSLAQPNTIVIAPATHRLTTGHFRFNDLGFHSLKGIERPVRAYQVQGESSPESRFDARYNRDLTPLIGRDEEVELLRRRWDQARKGEGQVVLVTGEAGIGKSRLCETLASAISDDPHILLRYQSSPHHVNSALYPVITHIEQTAEISASLGTTAKLEKLEKFLHQSSEWLEEDTPLVATLLSIPDNGRYPPLSLDMQEQKKRTFRALIRYFQGLTAQGTVLVLFEDLHWADPSTLELLDMLMEKAVELPLAMLATFRPEFESAWMGQAHVSLIALNRISQRECKTMLAKLIASNSLSENVIDEIMIKTDGVPLFIEEVTRTVLETQVRIGKNASTEVQFEIPTTLQDSLNGRLDRLMTGKKIAQTGAAIGREFTEETLASVCELGQPELHKALDELVNTGLLFRYGKGLAARYVFKHALLQDAAYNSLLLTDRKSIHSRIAQRLTAHSPDDNALLAHHWEHAGDFDKALHHWLEAAERSAARYDRIEAVAQYRRALNVLDQLPETQETRLLHVKTIIAVSSSGVRWQDQEKLENILPHFDKAIHSAIELGELAYAARLESFKGNANHDGKLILQALKHAEQSGEQTVISEIAAEYSGFLGNSGRYEESRKFLQRAIELQGQLGQSFRQALLMAIEGRCYSARAGRLDESLAYARQARQFAEELDDAWLQSCLVMECEPTMYKGLWRETIEIARMDLPAALEVKNWTAVLFSSAWAAFASIKAGKLDDAREFIEVALSDDVQRPQHYFPLTYINIVVGQLQLASGETEKALATTRRAVAQANGGGYLLEHGAANRTLGQILHARDNQAEADAAFRLSLQILHNIQSLPELAQSLLAYGQFKLNQDSKEGTKLLAQALEVFQQIEATGWVEETQIALG